MLGLEMPLHPEVSRCADAPALQGCSAIVAVWVRAPQRAGHIQRVLLELQLGGGCCIVRTALLLVQALLR